MKVKNKDQKNYEAGRTYTESSDVRDRTAAVAVVDGAIPAVVEKVLDLSGTGILDRGSRRRPRGGGVRTTGT